MYCIISHSRNIYPGANLDWLRAQEKNWALLAQCEPSNLNAEEFVND